MTKQLDKKNWDTDKLLYLLQRLYDGTIDIPRFKEQMTAAGMDYNDAEHCGCCVGCCNHQTDSEHFDCDSSASGFHNWEHNDCKGCKLVDTLPCGICGNSEVYIEYPIRNSNDRDEILFTFWVCEKHAFDPKLERSLRRGITPNRMYEYTKLANR